MNKKDVLIGAVAGVILLVAGLAVGLSINGSSNGSPSLGAIASTWTNFGKSGVTTQVGFAVNNTSSATTTLVINDVGGYPIQQAPNGSGNNSVFTITTSTTLAGNYECLYDLIDIPTGAVSGITITLPVATSTVATCLPLPGTQDKTLFENDSTNTVALASSTGDIFAYGSTGSAQLASSTGSTYTSITSWNISNPTATVLYELGNSNTKH